MNANFANGVVTGILVSTLVMGAAAAADMVTKHNHEREIKDHQVCVRAEWTNEQGLEYESMNILIPENKYEAVTMTLLPMSYCK